MRVEYWGKRLSQTEKYAITEMAPKVDVEK